MFITVVIHTKDVSLFGVMMDSWQRPIAEVGLAGADGGRGGKYLVLPPNYQGDLPLGYLVAHQKTYEGYFLFRPVIAGNSESNLKKAIIYHLSYHLEEAFACSANGANTPLCI
jgi:hypothetical protein